MLATDPTPAATTNACNHTTASGFDCDFNTACRSVPCHCLDPHHFPTTSFPALYRPATPAKLDVSGAPGVQAPAPGTTRSPIPSGLLWQHIANRNYIFTGKCQYACLSLLPVLQRV